MVKNLPAMQETQVRSLDWEDPLEKRMATLSSILAWRNPWTGKPGGLQSMGLQESDMTERLTLSPPTENNKVLLYSTANYVQCPVINHNVKEYEKEYIYI